MDSGFSGPHAGGDVLFFLVECVCIDRGGGKLGMPQPLLQHV